MENKNFEQWQEKFFNIIDAEGIVENEKGKLESPSDIIKRNFISKKEIREMIEKEFENMYLKSFSIEGLKEELLSLIK